MIQESELPVYEYTLEELLTYSEENDSLMLINSVFTLPDDYEPTLIDLGGLN